VVLAALGFTFIPEYAVTVPGLRIRPLIDPEINLVEEYQSWSSV
jgi:LysR family transcriptional regulator, hydrogen peroxide-inducible genes activator